MPTGNDDFDKASNHSHGSNMSAYRVRRRSDDFLEKYVIVKHIGEGSMGFISKAKIKSSKIGGSAYHGQEHSLIDGCGCFGFMGWFKRKYQTTRYSTAREGRVEGEIYYALKTILMSRICPEFIDELRNEIEILKELDHPNIVKVKFHDRVKSCSN
jgi:serine/threonine protein kinase